MNHIGKKVRITEYYTDHIGQTGIIISEGGEGDEEWVKVRMPDGKTHHPYKPDSRQAQCEWVQDNLYSIDKIKGKKIAIHCSTQQEWDDVTKVLDYDWSPETKWNNYRDCSAISVECKGYTEVEYYKVSGYQIITAKEFLLDNNITTDSNMEALEKIQQLEKELAELKESLNKPKWKPRKGEWIKVLDTGCCLGSSNTVKRGDILQVLDELDPGVRIWEIRTAKGRLCQSELADLRDKEYVRLATAAEIAATQVKTVLIGSKGLEVTINSKGIHADGKTVRVEDIESLIKKMQDMDTDETLPWEVNCITVKIGCVDDVKLEQLQQIVTLAKQVNS